MTIQKSNINKAHKVSASLVITIGGLIILFAVIIHLSILHSMIFNPDPVRVMDSSSSFSSSLGEEKSFTITNDESIQEVTSDDAVPMPKGYPSKLSCGLINTARYAYLHNQTLPNEPPVQFLFALDLDDAVHVVHTLFLAISQAIIHLGPERCALSIVGNPSKDGTWAYLEELEVYMEKIGVRTFLKKSVLNSRESSTTRIEKLAQLRNEALEPLYYLTERKEANSSTIIIFSNDISLCPNDVLELVHQHIYQKADSVCALDWNDDAIFYDTWISRTLTGHLFLDVEKHLWWKEGKIFFNDPVARQSLDRKKPFQVFSCWNGILTLSSEPFLKSNIRFRAPIKDECQGGEPFHLSIDFWNHGYYKIAVAPTVNVAYDDRTAKQARAKHGTSENLKLNLSPIVWSSNAPPKVSCPDLNNNWKVSYVSWDDALSIRKIILKEVDNIMQKIQSYFSPFLAWVQKILIVMLVVMFLRIKRKNVQDFLESVVMLLRTKRKNVQDFLESRYGMKQSPLSEEKEESQKL